MKRKLSWMLMSFLLVTALVLTSCGPAVVPGEQEEEEPVGEQEEEEEPVGEQEEEEEPVVEENRLEFAYVTIGDLDCLWLADLYNGFKEAADMLGADTTIGLGDWDFFKLIDVLDLAMARGVDGIFVHNWMDPPGTVPSYEKALALGIPVYLVGVRPEPLTVAEIPVIAGDLEAQARDVGLDTAKRLKAAGRTTDVNLTIFVQDIGAPFAIIRGEDVDETLREEGIDVANFRWLEVGDEFAKCVDMIKAHLIAFPETDVIWGDGAVTTPACFMALQELGYAPGEILWTGYDLVPVIVDGIRAGYGATSVDTPFAYGFLGVMALYLQAEYGINCGDLSLRAVMTDQDNLDEVLKYVQVE